MKYFLWRLLKRCFWMKFSTHWSHPKTDDRYYGEWEQKRQRIRNNLTYKLVGAKNPGEQKCPS